MTKRFLLVVTILATAALASAKTYNVTLFQPALVGDTELKPGDYKVDVEDNKAVVRGSKGKVAEAPIKVQNTDTKNPSTSVRYDTGAGKARVQEIRLGGTNSKIVFEHGQASAAGSLD